MRALVGYTGFVGSNLAEHGQFDRLYNSKNIDEAAGTGPELLVYAGLRAEKFLANSAPEKDLALIYQAEENIRRIEPERVVLISTIDVFKTPRGVDENTEISTEGLAPYGRNRYQLERWVRQYDPEALIVRLPALFGKNLKKNFLYDFIHRIPSMLNGGKFAELSRAWPPLADYYRLQDNGFYKLRELNGEERALLKERFARLGFSALNFTDSRSVFQFYPLARLWGDIELALRENLRLFHPATEPVSAGELYRFLTGEDFRNELGGPPAGYDYRTVHSALFGRTDGYICGKEEILAEIRKFVEEQVSGND